MLDKKELQEIYTIFWKYMDEQKEKLKKVKYSGCL